MDHEAIVADLLRYIETYKWDWGVAHKLLYQRHGCTYTIEQLKKLYQSTLEEQGRLY